MQRKTKFAAVSVPLVVSGHIGIVSIVYSLPGDIGTISGLISTYPAYYTLAMLATGAWLKWLFPTLWNDGFSATLGFYRGVGNAAPFGRLPDSS